MSASDELQNLYRLIKGACAPAQWKKGATLVRHGAIVRGATSTDELEFRVTSRHGPLTLSTSLYPLDGEWDCSCGQPMAVCEHVAACIRMVTGEVSVESAPPEPLHALGRVRYAFKTDHVSLRLERQIVRGSLAVPLRVSLTAAAAGRVRAPNVMASPHDLDVEQANLVRPDGKIPRERMPKLLKLLASCEDVEVDGQAVRCSSRPVAPLVVVDETTNGFELTLEPEPATKAVFANGAALVGEMLRPIWDGPISRDVMRRLSLGYRIAQREVPYLVTELLPMLREHLRVEIRTRALPSASRDLPRVVVNTRRQADKLHVIGQLVYGDPITAHVIDGELEITGDAVPIRDHGEEERMKRDLRRDLGLVAGQPALLDGAEAITFTSRLACWGGEVSGSGHRGFTIAPELQPIVSTANGTVTVTFETDDGVAADARKVIAAWQRKASLVALDGSGWSPLPVDFLQRHGHLVADLLDAMKEDNSLPACLGPDIVALCDDVGLDAPKSLRALRQRFEAFDEIPNYQLPSDLDASLRQYQREGINWLAFLRDLGMGALLADDMGLGKTLQALSIIEGRTLVVAPTSVIRNWVREANRFRPGLDVCLYHGPNRRLSMDADLVVTSYALMRLDAHVLTNERWQMAILDEAQAIKNPKSQVTSAAMKLRADFALTLTGTPVENRLEELWSQMRFCNRGLLGSRKGFHERYAKPIEGGEGGAASRLRERIRPFVLRRLKADVASELPPKTETVLHVTLSDKERLAYDSIRAATQKELVAELGRGLSPLDALAALMRLRQASCHRDLLPGQTASNSSKVELLVDVLSSVVSEGHKALVFSQWTSLLDRVEPHLNEADLSFVRLDGSTTNREKVVQRFQSEDGPPVMLISLKAGGTGLNLTAADHVFLLDPWWNPAVEDQAADRAHRIGQQRPVIVHRLVALDTVEERIVSLQAKKRRLAEAALDGAEQAAGLTRDDLLALLS